MDRLQFLNELAAHLRKVPEVRRRDLLADYDEHFRIGKEKGLSESAIAAALGSPKQVAAAFYTEQIVGEAEAAVRSSAKLRSLSRVLVAVIGLGFFNAVFVVGPFVGALGILAGLWALALAPGAVGLALLGEGVSDSGAGFFGSVHGAGYLFLAIGLFAAALLFSMAMSAVTRWFAVITAKYVRINLEIVTQ